MLFRVVLDSKLKHHFPGIKEFLLSGDDEQQLRERLSKNWEVVDLREAGDAELALAVDLNDLLLMQQAIRGELRGYAVEVPSGASWSPSVPGRRP